MIYISLFFQFFKIGLFTFGGGYAMIPLIKETVITNAWMTEEAFYDFIGICESTPGPIGVNIATYVGNVTGGIAGGVIATLGVILPSFLVIILILTILKKITNNQYFKAFISGVTPIIVSLILFTGVELLLKSLGYQNITSFNFNWRPCVILGILIIFNFIYKKLFKRKMNAIFIILISAGLGILICML